MAGSIAATFQVVGADGEVALRKELAGRTVAIRELEPGTWIVKVGESVPENERWLFDPAVRATLDRALAWAAQNPPCETDLDALEERILGGSRLDSTGSE